jgi:tryptophan synthase alpha chain
VDEALAAGTTPADVLSTVQEVARTGVPVLVMTYWNPVEQYGVDRFARDLAAAGGAGMITPDLTPEEAGPWLAAADVCGLDPVFLVAPSSTDERVERISRLCRGFVYATSVMGVTGERARTSDRAPALVARVRAVTDTPVGVGLGVSTGDQAAEVAGYADGVIVGSAFARTVLEADSPAAAVAGVGALAADLAAGVARPATGG